MSFQSDTTAALLPLLAEYNLSSASVTSFPGGTPFSVTAPVVTPPAPPDPSFQLGFNLGGLWSTNSQINDPGFSLTQLLIDMGAFKTAGYIRAWGTCSLINPIPMTQFATTIAQAQAGLKPIYVYNTQNNGGNIPTQAQVTAHFNSWPTAAISGVYAVELVNEHDNSQYLNQTSTSVAELAMLFMTAGPILKAKGYKVIGSNCLSSFGYYQDTGLKPALKPQYIDSIGRHGYASDAATAMANVTKVKLYADSLDLGFMQTEAGLREANYAVELPKYWSAMKALGGTHIAFTLYQISTSSTYGYQNQPYLAPNVAGPLYPVLKGALS